MKSKIHNIIGFYVNEENTNKYEIWLAPECPYECEECAKQDILKAKRWGPEDKFKIKKLLVKK